MGWTGYNTNKKFEEVFADEYHEWFGSGSKYQILKFKETPIDCSSIHDEADQESEIFSAVKNMSTGFVFTHVLLIKRIGKEVLYKGMDEFVGPNQVNDVPKEIIKLLSPISSLPEGEHYYAAEWRKRNNINK